MDYIRDLNLKNKQLKENEIKIYFYYYYYFNRYASNTVKKKEHLNKYSNSKKKMLK